MIEISYKPTNEVLIRTGTFPLHFGKVAKRQNKSKVKLIKANENQFNNKTKLRSLMIAVEK